MRRDYGARRWREKFDPAVERKTDRRFAEGVLRVRRVPARAVIPIPGLKSAVRNAGRHATIGRKMRSVPGSAEVADTQPCGRGAIKMAARSHARFAPAQIQRACRTQLRTGTPFRTRGSLNICRCVRRSLRSLERFPAQHESSGEFALAENRLPDARACRSGNGSSTVRSVRNARSLHRQAVAPECCESCSRDQKPPTNRPLANVPFGSKAFFTRRWSSRDSGARASAASSSFHSVGQNTIWALNSSWARSEPTLFQK